MDSSCVHVPLYLPGDRRYETVGKEAVLNIPKEILQSCHTQARGIFAYAIYFVAKLTHANQPSRRYRRLYCNR